MNLKTKPLTRKQLTKIIEDYEERFLMIAESLEAMKMSQPDYSGALQLNVANEEDIFTSFYMVTKFCIRDPYILFHHLLPVDSDSTTTINSFPEKPSNKSTKRFIRSLEKEKRWNKIHERLLIPTVSRMQFIGHFTYTKSTGLEDTDASFVRPESTVLEFKPGSEQD